MDPKVSDIVWYLISVACPLVLGTWWVVVTRRKWLRPKLVVAMILFVVFAGIWLWIDLTTNEDVPDPSWTDYLGDVIGFLMYVPAALFLPDTDYPSLARVIFVLGADSLFWGFVSVSLYQICRRYIQKRRVIRSLGVT
jgi:hypothetical protein